MPAMQPGVLGYRNVVAEMDVDIEIDTQPDTGTIQQEAFNELMRLVGMSPVYQQQISLKQLIQLSPIPHKRSVLDSLARAEDEQSQARAQQQQVGQQMAAAKIQEVTARAALHHASGFAHALNAVSEAHAVHNDHAIAGIEAGLASGQGGSAPGQQGQAPPTQPSLP
jgi:hypothetical protein